MCGFSVRGPDNDTRVFYLTRLSRGPQTAAGVRAPSEGSAPPRQQVAATHRFLDATPEPQKDQKSEPNPENLVIVFQVDVAGVPGRFKASV